MVAASQITLKPPRSVMSAALFSLRPSGLLRVVAAAGVAVLFCGGCHSWTSTAASDFRLLRPPASSAESVTLEIYRVRLSVADGQTLEEIWQDADEQFLPSEIRLALARNGMKAGVLPVSLPPSLERALQLKGEPLPNPDEFEQLQTVDVAREPLVRRRIVQFRTGHRAEIVASETYDELPLLFYGGDGLAGQSYARAQCVLDVTAANAADGRITLKLTPKIQHGEPKQRYRGDEGVLRPDFSRPARVLEDMIISADLSAGQMLLVGPQPSRPGSVGDYFFSRGPASGVEQKLFLIRLLRGPAEEPYSRVQEP
jgi:hypothetical protein